MTEQKIRRVFIFRNYFFEFFEKQNQKVKDKIIWTIKIIETVDQIPAEYFKHLEGTNGLYEIRVQTGNNIFRIFSFFDEGKIGRYNARFSKENTKDAEKRN